MQGSTFYVVYSPTGATPPRVHHATFESAKQEAARLARLNANQKFYVLQAVVAAEFTPVTFTALT